MNFFDRATNAMENMGKNVSKAAKDNMEIAKCTSAIKSCEEKLNAAYAELGKRYYFSETEVSRDTFSDLFEVIQQHQKQIDDLRGRLQEIKGIQICKVCGAEVSREARFCRSCGAQIVQPESEPAAAPVCWNCHSPLTGTEKFCAVCGANLSQKPEAEVQAPAEQQAAPEPPVNMPPFTAPEENIPQTADIPEAAPEQNTNL